MVCVDVVYVGMVCWDGGGGGGKTKLRQVGGGWGDWRSTVMKQYAVAENVCTSKPTVYGQLHFFFFNCMGYYWFCPCTSLLSQLLVFVKYTN